MKLLVNGGEQAVDPALTLADLAVRLQVPERGAAVAVNSAVIPRGRWATTTLHDGDAVEVLVATQGG